MNQFRISMPMSNCFIVQMEGWKIIILIGEITKVYKNKYYLQKSLLDNCDWCEFYENYFFILFNLS